MRACLTGLTPELSALVAMGGKPQEQLGEGLCFQQPVTSAAQDYCRLVYISTMTNIVFTYKAEIGSNENIISILAEAYV